MYLYYHLALKKESLNLEILASRHTKSVRTQVDEIENHKIFVNATNAIHWNHKEVGQPMTSRLKY